MSTFKGRKTGDVFRNRTEIHNLFIVDERGSHIAFESDILSSGCTRVISEIESVVIELEN